METLKELWTFMRVRKKFWLAPIILALLLLGGLIILAGGAGVLSPFVYMM
jgi:Family of unknown function (DUF5989)